MLMTSDVAKFFKGIYGISEVTTDGVVFKLHHRFTCIVLLGFSAIIYTNQLIGGGPIKCTFSSAQTSWLPAGYLDSYCWIHPKQTIASAHHQRVGVQVAYPGVDNGTPPETEHVTHRYYQWVTIVLFLQALCFYFPRFLWRNFEGDKIKKILSGLNYPILKKDDRQLRIRHLAEYLSESVGHHGSYGGLYIACESLNLLNVIGQLYATDAFLVGDFMTYGIDVIRHARLLRHNATATETSPMDRMFPKDIKCLFYSYGAGGSVATRDGLCILPVNIINEKVFLFLFFWYIILACCTSLSLANLMCLLHCKKLRWSVLARYHYYADRYTLRKMVMNLNYSDWFIVYLLCKNMDTLCFRELVQELDKSLFPEKPIKMS